MLPVCVMVPPPSPTFYCALFIYFVVFFLSWLLFSCSHRAIIVCVCVTDVENVLGVLFGSRARSLIEIAYFVAKSWHLGCAFDCMMSCQKINVQKKSARARPFLLSQNRLFYSPACISLHTAGFFCSISPLLLLFLFQLWRVICCLVLFVICCHRKCVLWILWLLKCRQQ